MESKWTRTQIQQVQGLEARLPSVVHRDQDPDVAGESEPSIYANCLSSSGTASACWQQSGLPVSKKCESTISIFQISRYSRWFKLRGPYMGADITN
jgi:hypothetical protein